MTDLTELYILKNTGTPQQRLEAEQALIKLRFKDQEPAEVVKSTKPSQSEVLALIEEALAKSKAKTIADHKEKVLKTLLDTANFTRDSKVRSECIIKAKELMAQA